MGSAFAWISCCLFGTKDPEIPKADGGKTTISTPRRAKPKQWSQEDPMMDKEYNIVIVPSGTGRKSGPESDGSDWSVGWTGPHDHDFVTTGKAESSLPILVPFHRRFKQMEVPKKQDMGALELHNRFSFERRKNVYIEQWFSSRKDK